MRALIDVDDVNTLVGELSAELRARVIFDVYGTRLAVTATSEGALERLRKVYRYFILEDAAADSPVDARIVLVEHDHPRHARLAKRLRSRDPLGVTKGHLLIADWLDFALSLADDTLLHYYASKLIRLHLVACHDPEIITLHAASLATGGGEGLLIVGEAASGKTTLALRLIEHGFRFCSDDTSCIRRRDRSCVPFPLAFILRGGPGGTPPRVGETNGREPDLNLLDEPRWLLERCDAVAGPFRPSRIVFLHSRVHEQPGYLQPMRPAQAALELLRNIVVPLGAEQLDNETTCANFDLVCDLVNAATCYEVNSTDLDQTVDGLLSAVTPEPA